MKTTLFYSSLIISLLFISISLKAQDAHYWTLQYGPKSSLLGGAKGKGNCSN